MRSKPKAYAIGVVALEILFCFLIYLCCVYVRRRRHGHSLKDVFKSSKDGVDDISGLKLGTDSSVLVFFPFSALKGLDHTKTMRLRCMSCQRELTNDDETLRLMPKCGHVFHPLCLTDPCSALCPCSKVTCGTDGSVSRTDVGEIKSDPPIMCGAEAKDDSSEIAESEAEVKTIDGTQVQTELKPNCGDLNKTGVEAVDVIVEIDLLEEKVMTKIPEEILEKIIDQAKVISPAGEVYSKTRYLW
ncbi:hypothetical protein RND81_04G008900 [Saponaria officinalis]|uniref:RING-type domain-containing protein n=1 Tax=Saponaria officinalis TaxID=3572 RepID=A0AAW1LGR5_SAPOF